MDFVHQIAASDVWAIMLRYIILRYSLQSLKDLSIKLQTFISIYAYYKLISYGTLRFAATTR